MTWLWRICFSGLWLLPVWCASVGGSVELVGSRESAVRRRKDFSGVVIWLEPVGEAAPLRSDPHRVEMKQQNKRFLPHVLAIPVGASVDFPNFDPIFHSAFSNYSGQTFDVGLYKPGTSKTVVFTRPGIVRVFCNIHPTMSAVIAVLDTPWFAVSSTSGAYAIRDVRPGDYQLHIFHERATEDTLHSLIRRIIVTQASAQSVSAIEISETGYIPAPHKDKYGRDYPPVIDNPGYGAKP